MPSITHLYSNSTATDGTTVTFPNVPLGTPNTTRHIAVAIACLTNTQTALSGVTINGVTATIVGQIPATGQNSRVCIVEAIVPTGTSVSVVLTCAQSIFRSSISVFSLVDYPDAGIWLTDTVNPFTINVPSDPNATALIGVCYNAQNTTATWTSAIEVLDVVVENHQLTAAYGTNNSGSNMAVSLTFGSVFATVLGLAYWIPVIPPSPIVDPEKFSRSLVTPLVVPLKTSLKK